jgi:hypothetical protein
MVLLLVESSVLEESLPDLKRITHNSSRFLSSVTSRRKLLLSLLDGARSFKIHSLICRARCCAANEAAHAGSY